MSRYVFSVAWIYPDGTSYPADISDKIISVGSLNYAISDASQLNSFVAPDLEFTVDNHDGFWTDQVASGLTPGTDLNTPTDRFIIDLYRKPSPERPISELVRLFRGYVLLTSITLNAKDRTASFTALGPMRLCDTSDASTVRRAFPPLSLGAYAANGASTIILNVTAELYAGDEILLGTNDKYVVAGINGTTATLTGALTSDYKEDTAITVGTPYLRNQYIGDNLTRGLVQLLFTAAGVSASDVRWTSPQSDDPFFQTFDTDGTSGYGELRGIRQGYYSSSAEQELRAAFATGANGIRYANAGNSGFLDFEAPAGDTTDYEGTLSGGYAELGQQGIGSVVAGQWRTVFDSNKTIRIPADSVKVTLGDQTHWRLIVKRFGWHQYAGSDYLYELRLTQQVGFSDFNESGVPDYGDSAAAWKVEIYKYTSGDRGLTWIPEAGWYPYGTWHNAPSVIGGNGPKVYGYRLVARGGDGTILGVSREKTTVDGFGAPIGPTTLSGGNYVSLAIPPGAPNGTQTVDVFRTYSTNESIYGLGKIGSASYASGGVFSDTGQPADGSIVSGLVEFSQYAYLVGIGPTASDASPSDVSVIDYPWSLSVSNMSGIIGSGPTTYELSLFVSVRLGGAIDGSNLRIIRYHVSYATNGIVLAFTLHYNAGESLLTATDNTAGYTDKQMELYWYDYSSAAIVHSMQQVNHTTGWMTETSTIGLPAGDSGACLRTIKWNQRTGAESRIALFCTSETIGTAVAILIPGHTDPAGNSYPFALESFETLTADVAFTKQTHNQAVPYISTHTRNRGNLWSIPNPQFVDDNNPIFITPWLLIIGGVTRTVWVGFAAGRWFVLSNYFIGFISYADFEGMTVSTALQELGFLVNAISNVTWQSSGAPIGKFLSYDKAFDTTASPIMLQNLNGTNPLGNANDLLLEVEHRRVWEKSANYVKVTGKTDLVVGEAGNLGYQEQGLQVSSRFVDTISYAQMLARSLYYYYGPATAAGLSKPRQSAKIRVIDNGIVYDIKQEVRLNDPFATPDPNDITQPLAWWIEAIDFDPMSPEIALAVVQRDVIP